jgi:hypothetical protein
VIRVTAAGGIAEMDAAADAVAAREFLQRLDQGHRRERFAVERNGDALLENEGMGTRFERLAERFRGQHPGIFRDAILRG